MNVPNGNSIKESRRLNSYLIYIIIYNAIKTEKDRFTERMVIIIKHYKHNKTEGILEHSYIRVNLKLKHAVKDMKIGNKNICNFNVWKNTSIPLKTKID